jgi:hypothetical protein
VHLALKYSYTNITIFRGIGAAKVSVLQMLQEDWSHPITSHLALYSCHMYLKNPGTWDDPTDEEEPDDGEEVGIYQTYVYQNYRAQSCFKIVTLIFIIREWGF